MPAVAALPLRLVAQPKKSQINYRSASAKARVPFEPVRYAYCLIDFASDTEVGEKALSSHPAAISEKVSDEITWQLACRTNADGFLVALDQSSAPKAAVDEFWRFDGPDPNLEGPPGPDPISWIPPLLVNAGCPFNLFWCYQRGLFERTRKGEGEFLVTEADLARCSTYLHGREDIFTELFRHTSPDFYRLLSSDEGSHAELVRKQIFRESNWYERETVHWSWADVEFLDTGPTRLAFVGKPAPSLAPDDWELETALYLSQFIIEATEEHFNANKPAAAARLSRILDIRQRYHDRDAIPPEAQVCIADEDGTEILPPDRPWSIEYDLNGFVALIDREETWDHRFSSALELIHKSNDVLKDAVKRAGQRLEKVYRTATLQAVAHYDKDESAKLLEVLQYATSIYLFEDLCQMFTAEKRYEETQLIEVVKGAPASNLLEQFFQAYAWGKSWALFDILEQAGKGSVWLEGIVQNAVVKHPDRVKNVLDKINHFLSVLEGCSGLTGRPAEVVKLVQTAEEIVVEIDGTAPVRIKLRGALTAGAKVLDRIGQFVKVANAALAIKNIMSNPSLKDAISAAGSVVAAANAFEYAQKEVCKKFDVTKVVFERVALSCALVVTGIEMAEHLGEGNNLAVLADMLAATLGMVELLDIAPNGVGWALTALAIAGTVAVYLLMSDDEKFIQAWNTTYRRHDMGAWEFRFQTHKYDDHMLTDVDEFLEARSRILGY